MKVPLFPITNAQTKKYRNCQKQKAVALGRKQLLQSPTNFIFSRKEHAVNTNQEITTMIQQHVYDVRESNPEYLNLAFLTNDIILASDVWGQIDIIELPPHYNCHNNVDDALGNDGAFNFSNQRSSLKSIFKNDKMGKVLAFNLKSSSVRNPAIFPPSFVKMKQIQSGKMFVSGAANGEMTIFHTDQHHENYMKQKNKKRSLKVINYPRIKYPKRKFFRPGLPPIFNSYAHRNYNNHTGSVHFQASVPFAQMLSQSGFCRHFTDNELMMNECNNVDTNINESFLISGWTDGYFPPHRISQSSSLCYPPPLSMQNEFKWDFQEHQSHVLGIHIDSEQDCFSILDSRLSLNHNNKVYGTGQKPVVFVDLQAFHPQSSNEREDITSICFHGDNYLATSHVITRNIFSNMDTKQDSLGYKYKNIIKIWDKRLISGNAHSNSSQPVDTQHLNTFPGSTIVPLQCTEQHTIQMDVDEYQKNNQRKIFMKPFLPSQIPSNTFVTNPICRLSSSHSNLYNDNKTRTLLVSLAPTCEAPYTEDIIVDESFTTFHAYIPMKQTFLGSEPLNPWNTIVSPITPDHSAIGCIEQIGYGVSNFHLYEMDPYKMKTENSDMFSETFDFKFKPQCYKQKCDPNYRTLNSMAKKRKLGEYKSSCDYLIPTNNSTGLIPFKLNDKNDFPSNLKTVAMNDIGTAIIYSNDDGDLFLCRGI